MLASQSNCESCKIKPNPIDSIPLGAYVTCLVCGRTGIMEKKGEVRLITGEELRKLKKENPKEYRGITLRKRNAGL